MRAPISFCHLKDLKKQNQDADFAFLSICIY